MSIIAYETLNVIFITLLQAFKKARHGRKPLYFNIPVQDLAVQAGREMGLEGTCTARWGEKPIL